MRWCLFKLAEALIRGSDEAPPSITIHLPPTPVVEVPPPLPPARPPKPQRTLSIKAPVAPSKSPLIPFAAPPKLKLPMNGGRKLSITTPLGESKKPSNTYTVPALPIRKGATKPTPKPAPKATPNSALNRNDMIVCQNAIRKLKAHKAAVLFLQPVDPVRDGAPK